MKLNSMLFYLPIWNLSLQQVMIADDVIMYRLKYEQEYWHERRFVSWLKSNINFVNVVGKQRL